MPNTDKELTLLAAEEKKLLEQQKNERDALKKRLAVVKKKIREEQRRLNERRAELLGRCMMQRNLVLMQEPKRPCCRISMDSCRSRKTWNCSDYSRNRLPNRKTPEASPGLSCSWDRLPYVSAERRRSQYHANRESPVWHRRGKPFLWECACGCRAGMAQDGGALNGIVCPWRSSKAGCTVAGCSMFTRHRRQRLGPDAGGIAKPPPGTGWRSDLAKKSDGRGERGGLARLLPESPTVARWWPAVMANPPVAVIASG